jgi:uncharacterized membrane protein YwzB
MDTLVSLIIAVVVLLVAWWVVERFSPDELITKICKVIIFVLALLLVITKLLPMVGVSF